MELGKSQVHLSCKTNTLHLENAFSSKSRWPSSAVVSSFLWGEVGYRPFWESNESCGPSSLINSHSHNFAYYIGGSWVSRYWPWALCYLPGSLNPRLKFLSSPNLTVKDLEKWMISQSPSSKAPKRVLSTEIFHGAKQNKIALFWPSAYLFHYVCPESWTTALICTNVYRFPLYSIIVYIIISLKSWHRGMIYQYTYEEVCTALLE